MRRNDTSGFRGCTTTKAGPGKRSSRSSTGLEEAAEAGALDERGSASDDGWAEEVEALGWSGGEQESSGRSEGAEAVAEDGRGSVRAQSIESVSGPGSESESDESVPSIRPFLRFPPMAGASKAKV